MNHLLVSTLALTAGICAGAELAPVKPRFSLPDARAVQLEGRWGDAYRRGVARLGEDPYRSAAYLRADFSFEMSRIFVNYSGDISGRYTEITSLMSPPGPTLPATLAEVLRDIGRHQRPDGHFGREVNWNDPLEPENSNNKLLPIFWGNSRLLMGLLEAHRTFGRPDLLEAARRIGDFYIATADRFLDPARENEYRMTGTYAAGYVTDYFPGIEGLARLYQATRDPRYLRQAERMAEFFRRFDALPIDHSHGNLITHCGLLLLYEITGKPEYLEQPRRRWREAVVGGFVWPTGGVGEKFRVSCATDEGCSESDWLRLNLNLWRLTGDRRYLEMAERLLWNHFAMNLAPNGGYGHHNFVCDAGGPLLMKPQFTEAVWCCTFHGLLGLHTLKSYVVAGAPQGVLVNFPLSVRSPVETAAGPVQVQVSADEQPGAIACTVRVEVSDRSKRPPDVFVRVPAWAERTSVADAGGKSIEAAVEDGYVRLPGAEAAKAGLRVAFEFSPRIEDRRMRRMELKPAALERFRGVTFWNGPHLLLASAEAPRSALVAVVDKNGRLKLAREPDGGYRLVLVPNGDVSEQAIAEAAKDRRHLVLQPWERTRRDASAAFVFDLITIPETGPADRVIQTR